MRIRICDNRNVEVASLRLDDGRVTLEGSFPGGLTPQDLERLGFVYYETDGRGEISARVREVAPGETLEYVRAVLDALPPGFHISHVESASIETQRQARRARFEEELQRITEDG